MAIPSYASVEDRQENEQNVNHYQEVSHQRMARSRLRLDFGRHLPLPVLAPSPSREETQAEGYMLFEDFMTNQVQQAGLQQQYFQIQSNIPSNFRNIVADGPVTEFNSDHVDGVAVQNYESVRSLGT